MKKALITSRGKIAAVTTETALKFVENRVCFVSVDCNRMSFVIGVDNIDEGNKGEGWEGGGGRGGSQVAQSRAQLLMNRNHFNRNRLHMASPQPQRHVVA